MARILRIRTRKNIILGLGVFFVFFLSLSVTHAAPPEGSTLTPQTPTATLADTAFSQHLVSNILDEFQKQALAAGSPWNCTLDANHLISSCTSKITDTKSPLQGASVSCSQYITIPGSDVGPGTSAAECKVSFRDNSTHTVGTAYNNAVGTTDESVQKDANSQTTGNQTTVTPPSSTPGCGITSFSNIGQCIVNAIGMPILAISTFILGIAGVLFNLVLVRTVFEFSSLIGNAPGLLLAWGILRDVGNMILLFGFIFMGLMTILDLHSFPTKKALPRLVIFAVLLNFSLFAAEAVIDTSNAFSSILYSQANNAPCGYATTVNATHTTGVSADNTGDANLVKSEDNLKSCLTVGIAGSIMSASGLSTIYSAKPQDVSIAVYIGLSLFAVIGAIVMIAASIMLVIRALSLTFLMVLAPLGFAGMAIPPLQGMANKWWSMLIHQSFFAPILLLLIFVSLKVSEGFASGGGNAGLGGALSDPNVSTMGIILVFTLVIGFLIASLVAAKGFGAAGATMAISMAKTAVRAPLGAIAGFTGRQTIGRGAAALQKTYESKAHNSMILRNNVLGLDSAFAGILAAGKKARFGGGTSYDENEAHHKARHEEFDKATRIAENKSGLDSAFAMPTTNQAQIDAKNDQIAEIAQRMSVKEAEELLKAMKKESERDAFTQNLSAEKFASLVKDGSSLTEIQKSQARTSRFKPLAAQVDIINDPDTTTVQKDTARRTIRDYAAKDLQNAPSDLLTNNTVLDTLSGSQRDDLIKSEAVNPAITRQLRTRDPIEQVKTAFTNGTDDVPAGGGAAVAGAVAGMKFKKVAKLPDEILAASEVGDILSPEMLRAIDTDGDISPATRTAIIGRLKIRAPREDRLKKWLATPNGQLWR